LVETICNSLTNKIRRKMPEIDDERAEVINYGLQLVMGEIPKTFIILLFAYMLGVFKLTLLSMLFILPYRTVSGGTHLRTHIGCVIATTIFYSGNAILSKYIVFANSYIKYGVIILVWIFSMTMIKMYAPADTVDVPILRKKDRKRKKVLSYIIMTISLTLGAMIKNNIISNLLIFGTLLQSIVITRFMYSLTKNKYGYEEYLKGNLNI